MKFLFSFADLAGFVSRHIFRRAVDRQDAALHAEISSWPQGKLRRTARKGVLRRVTVTCFPNDLGGYPPGRAGRARPERRPTPGPAELFRQLQAAYLCRRRDYGRHAPRRPASTPTVSRWFFKDPQSPSRAFTAEAFTRSEARGMIKRIFDYVTTRGMMPV